MTHIAKKLGDRLKSFAAGAGEVFRALGRHGDNSEAWSLKRREVLRESERTALFQDWMGI